MKEAVVHRSCDGGMMLLAAQDVAQREGKTRSDGHVVFDVRVMEMKTRHFPFKLQKELRRRCSSSSMVGTGGILWNVFECSKKVFMRI